MDFIYNPVLNYNDVPALNDSDKEWIVDKLF